MFYFDPMYFYYALPALIFALWAQWKVKSTFGRYARVPTSSGINGAQAANLLMERTGLHIGVRGTAGMLTDYYDPRSKSIYLSQSSTQNSVASVAVVAHELGHAIQDAEGYGPMRVRGAIVPAVTVGAWVGPLLFMIGLFLSQPSLAWLGIIFFSGSAIFALVTLPVEFNASSRALSLLQANGVLAREEMPGAQAVLSAAALTYVAAVAQSLATLLYYISLMNRRN